MRKVWFAAALVAATVSSVAMAAGYGTAGCGLGSLLFDDQKGMIQILAATTNGTFASQTFGITTGTSNCTDTAEGAKAAKVFIEANREALAKDMSRGTGETITSLTSIAGCNDAMTVGATLQKNFTTIFPNENVSNDDLVKNVLTTLKTDKTLACGNVG